MEAVVWPFNAAHPDQEDNAEIDSSPSGRRSAAHTATQSELLKGKRGRTAGAAFGPEKAEKDNQQAGIQVESTEKSTRTHITISSDAVDKQTCDAHDCGAAGLEKKSSTQLGELKRVREFHSHEIGAMYLSGSGSAEASAMGCVILPPSIHL